MSLYLGFDLSTQQLKIVACYENLTLHSKYTLEFDEYYKLEFGITKGVISNETNGEITTPVAVFISAFQKLLDIMHDDGFPFDKVKSISGSAQQHGTVFYTDQFSNLLRKLSAESNSWDKDLSKGFSYSMASNWQDRSTLNEVEDFEKALGNATELCNRTGSRAHFRFSGPQMRRRARLGGDEWLQTCHIGLISGLLDSLLTGIQRGVERGEACGTNLYNIAKGDWDDELLSLVSLQNERIDGVSLQIQNEASRKVRSMLGEVVDSFKSVPVAKYLIERYGFVKDCQVWPITGDNLATVMSLPLGVDDLLVSLGTSTTVLLLTEKYSPSVNCHMFRHPVCNNVYMGMLCYCNGALAREEIRDEVNAKNGNSGSKSWEKFDQLLTKNDDDHDDRDQVGIFFPLGEIIPNSQPVKKIWKYSSQMHGLEELKDVNVECKPRLIIESQALSCRMRVNPMLLDENGDDSLKKIVGSTIEVDDVSYEVDTFNKRPEHVYYVGGGSNNEEITKIFNDVLGPKNGGFRVEIGDACALGGCFRAIWGSEGDGRSYDEWIQSRFDGKGHLDRVRGGEEMVWRRFSDKVGMLNLAERELRDI